MPCFDYIIMRSLIYIRTEHHNLLSMYDPLGMSSFILQFAMNKLMRWSITLSAFRYVAESIKGEHNHWTDMLSQWGNMDRTEIKAARCTNQPIATRWTWNAQKWQYYCSTAQKNYQVNCGVFMTSSGQMSTLQYLSPTKMNALKHLFSFQPMQELPRTEGSKRS